MPDSPEISSSPGRSTSRRLPWTPPRVIDHGSLRHFVRDISGIDSDGSSMGVGGTMMAMM